MRICWLWSLKCSSCLRFMIWTIIIIVIIEIYWIHVDFLVFLCCWGLNFEIYPFTPCLLFDTIQVYFEPTFRGYFSGCLEVGSTPNFSWLHFFADNMFGRVVLVMFFRHINEVIFKVSSWVGPLRCIGSIFFVMFIE